MKPADVRKQIIAGDTAPLYLLEGDDLQSRHDFGLEFAGLVDEGLQAFNVQTYYANEATTNSTRDELIGDLLAAARTLPMMAPRRVLIVHEADRLLSPRKSKDDEIEPVPAAAAGAKKKRSLTPLEELEEYFEKPEPLTTVVFVAGQLDANRRLVKLLRKHAVGVDCGLDARWVQQRLEKDGLIIDAKATALLLDAIGSTGGRLRAEVEKLVLYASGEKAVTVQHVKDLVAPESDEPLEGPSVGMAIKDGNAKRALTELKALFENGAPYLPILGQIRWAAGQLRPDERARRAFDLVLETDLALKSSGGEPRYLLERLVIELCAPRPRLS
jgi:DNA polymerase-3 subunit delta